MHLSPNNIAAIAEVADQILGPAHPVTQLIRAIPLSPDGGKEAWAAIEALPHDQRRILAAMVAERMDMTPPTASIH